MATNYSSLARDNSSLAGTALLTGEVIPEMSIGTQSTVAQVPVTSTPSIDPTLMARFRQWESSQAGAGAAQQPTTSNWLGNLSAAGNLGLGIAGFLENRKTANLQRQALRNDIATAQEHRANRQALGASWNNAWNN